MPATVLHPFLLTLFEGQSGWLTALTSIGLFLASFRYLLSSLSSTFGIDLLDLLRRLLHRSTYVVEVDSAISPRLYNQLMAFLSAQPSFVSRVRVVCAVLNDGFSTGGGEGNAASRGMLTYRRDSAAYTEQMMERITDEVRKSERKSGKEGGRAKSAEGASQISYCPGFYTHTLLWQEVVRGSDGQPAPIIGSAPLEVTVEVRRGASAPGVAAAGQVSTGTPTKPVLVLTVRFAEQLRLQRLLREAEGAYNVSLARHVLVFTMADGGHTLEYALSEKRDRSTLVLPDKAAALFADAESFFTDQARRFYAARSLPYRRGYLLYGAPGCGKSSWVLALASYLSCPVYIVSLTENAMSDAMLRMILCRVPQGSLVLLEDVDCLFEDKEKEAAAAAANPGAVRQQRQRVTLSGLLNALDGVGAQQGSLVVMTTNHLAQLDNALIRAGRVDESVEFTLPDTDQAVEAFTKLMLPHQPYTPQVLVEGEVEELALPKSSRELQATAAAVEWGWMSRPLQDGELARLLRSVRRVFDERQYHSGFPPFLSYADLQAIFLSSHRHHLCRCFPQANSPLVARATTAGDASTPLLDDPPVGGTAGQAEPPPTLACAVQFVVLLREREPMKKPPPLVQPAPTMVSVVAGADGLRVTALP